MQSRSLHDRGITVRNVAPRPEPPPPPVVPLWRLTKGERIADACVWLHSHGRELRISVDGALVFSRLFRAWRPDDNLESVAGELLGPFNGKGWRAG